MKKKLIFIALILSVCLLGLFACDKPGEPDPPAKPVAISVTPLAVTLSVGGTVKLSVSTDSTQKVEFYSENENIATVDESGLITGVAEGSTVVFAEVEGKSSFCAVTVEQEIMLIGDYSILAPTALNLLKNGAFKLQPALRLGAAEVQGAAFTYETDNSGIAAVSADGTVSAINAGNANITIVFSDGEDRAEARVAIMVIRDLVFTLSHEVCDLSAAGDAPLPDKEIQLTVSVAEIIGGVPVPVPDADFTWDSDNPSVASVNPLTGKLTAQNAGTATITVTYDSVGAECTVRVWDRFIADGNAFATYVYGDLTGSYLLTDNIRLTSAQTGGGVHTSVFTGILDGDGYTLTTEATRVFCYISGGSIQNIKLVCSGLNLEGGVLAMEIGGGARLENITADVMLNYSSAVHVVGGADWRFDAAGALARTLNGVTLKNCDVYVTIPPNIVLGGTAPNDWIPNYPITEISAYGILYGAGATFENCAAYSDSAIQFARGGVGLPQVLPVPPVPPAPTVEIHSLSDLQTYAAQNVNFKLMADLVINYDGTLTTVKQIETLNTVFDGNGYTVTINAAHTQNEAAFNQNFIGTIGAEGVLKNTNFIYSMSIADHMNIARGSLLVGTNNGIMRDLQFSFAISSNAYMVHETLGYLSGSGTGLFENVAVMLLDYSTRLLQSGTYGRAGVINRTGEAATAKNIVIIGCGEAVNTIIAPGNGVNNIAATNVATFTNGAAFASGSYNTTAFDIDGTDSVWTEDANGVPVFKPKA